MSGGPHQVGPELWAYEARLRMLGIRVGRRMATVRLRGTDLLIHSPAPLTDDLRGGLEALGSVRFVVAASLLHGHRFMEQYSAAYPRAELFAPPGLERRRGDLPFADTLGDAPDPRWSEALDQAALHGQRWLTEILFHHRPSRTLIVGDACWNVTASTPLTARVWAGFRTGVAPTPAFRRSSTDRRAARASVERILAWDFDRILIGHGEIVESGGREACRRAYAWLL